MKRMSNRMYTDAHTRPRLSGLTQDKSSVYALTSHITYIGLSYVFNRSLPLSLALMKVSPSAGTR